MQNDGVIPDCSNSGCWKSLGERRCCDFQQGNYIVLCPGELDHARAKGLSTAHLKMLDANYHGGQKVACSASNTASCDNGYKPLDCQSYPFFPAQPGRGDVDLMVKGKKCPLQVDHLAVHAATVQDAWNDLIDLDPAIREWLNKVELVGYTEPLHPFLEPEFPQDDAIAA